MKSIYILFISVLSCLADIEFQQLVLVRPESAPIETGKDDAEQAKKVWDKVKESVEAIKANPNLQNLIPTHVAFTHGTGKVKVEVKTGIVKWPGVKDMPANERKVWDEVAAEVPK